MKEINLSTHKYALSNQIEDIQGSVIAISDSIDLLIKYLGEKNCSKVVFKEESEENKWGIWYQIYECNHSEYYISAVPVITDADVSSEPKLLPTLISELEKKGFSLDVAHKILKSNDSEKMGELIKAIVETSREVYKEDNA